MCVKWQNAMSDWFSIGNGTRQGGVLSPAFFARYIREVLNEIMASGVGCHIGDVCFNVLAYADDLVLLAPSWAMQHHCYATTFKKLDMTCDVTKTVCMVFTPLCRRKVVANSLPLLKLGSSYIHNFHETMEVDGITLSIDGDDFLLLARSDGWMTKRTGASDC